MMTKPPRYSRKAVESLADFAAFAAEDHDFHELVDRAAYHVVVGLDVDVCRVFRRSAGEAVELIASLTNKGRRSSLVDRENDAATYAKVVWPGAFSHSREGHSLRVAIEGESGSFGTLVADSQAPRAFTEAERSFAEAVVRILGAALRRAHLERDRARFSAVVTSTQEALFEITLEGRIFSWNLPAEALLGYARAETIGQSALMLFPDESTSAYLALINKLHQPDALGTVGTTLRREDGGLVDVELIATPIILPEGRVTAAAIRARDIGEQRRTSQALQMHLDILAHLPTAVMVWQLRREHEPSTMRLLMANQTAEHFAGSTFTDDGGRRFSDVGSFLQAERTGNKIATVVDSGRAGRIGDVTCGDHPGVQRSFEVHAFPLPDGCAGIMFLDVTDQRELVNQLQLAQRGETIGRLVGNVAHDFNNLLTVICGYAESLHERLGDAIAGDELPQIERASRSAQRLTRQLLDFGRRPGARAKSVDLADLIVESRGLLTRLLGEDIRLIAQRHEPILVGADAGQLEQIVLNLAVNARDAMPAGGLLLLEASNVQLPLATPDAEPMLRNAAPGSYGVLTVTDTGLGMDRSTLARAFEPFFTTKEHGRGTGLGLSTVFQIVQSSGGYITVHSELGNGTTFKVYLPARDRHDGSTTSTTTPAPTLTPPITATVLIVEDDDAVRSFVRRTLASAGHTILEAATPYEAVTIAGQFTGAVDLLLTDIVMPTQSGPELASRLLMKFADMRVLFMSGFTRDDVVGHRRMPTSASFIEKPFSARDLRQAVQRALNGDADRPHDAPALPQERASATHQAIH